MYLLAGDAKTIHWNATGVNAYSLHIILDDFEEALRKEGDRLAERARFLKLKPSITLLSLNNQDDLPRDIHLNDKTTTMMVQSLIVNAEGVSSSADSIRKKLGSCENAILDDIQEMIGRYVYLLRSTIK